MSLYSVYSCESDQEFVCEADSPRDALVRALASVSLDYGNLSVSFAGCSAVVSLPDGRSAVCQVFEL